MANKLYYKRSFINKKAGAACIECCVYADNSGTVKITDCNRTVNLEFSNYENGDPALNAYKINKLISELTAFRDKLVKANV